MYRPSFAKLKNPSTLFNCNKLKAKYTKMPKALESKNRHLILYTFKIYQQFISSFKYFRTESAGFWTLKTWCGQSTPMLNIYIRTTQEQSMLTRFIYIMIKAQKYLTQSKMFGQIGPKRVLHMDTMAALYLGEIHSFFLVGQVLFVL